MATVAEYYANKNIFITGATGFIGKVLIEKLLRCCPHVKAMYCLIRPKKGETSEARLDDLFTEKVRIMLCIWWRILKCINVFVYVYIYNTNAKFIERNVVPCWVHWSFHVLFVVANFDNFLTNCVSVTLQLYDNLRAQNPDFREKIHAITGDVLEEDLGISEKDRTFLAENTHIVFHSAATIRFDESLR